MKGFLQQHLKSPSELRKSGIMGLNKRNGHYIMPNNPRKFYNLVDDKATTKKILTRNNLPVPELYAIIKNSSELKQLEGILSSYSSFVIKPARGSGGKGILVIDEKKNENYFKPSGEELTLSDLRNHINNILGGLFSLGGKRDEALIEYKIISNPIVDQLSYKGAPDVRIIIYKGYPVMAMLRASTRQSDGRSNLHQGAIGIGIEMQSGNTMSAFCNRKYLKTHPDTKEVLIGVNIPLWPEVIKLATESAALIGLGYLGVDIMLDQDKGPLLIEVNARPGLAIQMVNQQGLISVLSKIDEQIKRFPNESLEKKLHYSMCCL